MSSIQHEIFIESIYNNQKLSILREYSITSCDHQTIFSCFYSPFIDLSDRPSLVFELMVSDWSKKSTNEDEFEIGTESIDLCFKYFSL